MPHLLRHAAVAAAALSLAAAVAAAAPASATPTSAAALSGPVGPSVSAGNPQQWNPLNGDVNSDKSATIYFTQRHVTTRGNVVMDLTDTTDGGFCMGLSSYANPYTLFAGPVCWSAGQYGQKTVATDVLAGTVFHVVAWKRASGSNNHWAGRLFY